MGQPDAGNSASSGAEFIGAVKPTEGSETSQYLQEEKSTEIPPVVASERGIAQTGCSNTSGVVGPFQGLPGESKNRGVVEGFWKGPPKRVIVP